MTIQQALDQRIPRIHREVWLPNTYLRLPLLKYGYVGPWAELYDDEGQTILGINPGTQRFLVPEILPVDEWEPYTGPKSEYEEMNFAQTYTEE
jgi:hypothetical protein